MLKIFSLLCHRDVEMASRCLASLLRHCQDPMQLTGIDDGSLTNEDVHQLDAKMPGISIIRRSEIDARIIERLRDFPLCRKYREWCPWATKLLDIPLYADGDFAYIDGDVLFLRRFRRLAGAQDPRALIVSMHAYANVYSFRLTERISNRSSTPVVARLNAGFFFARQQAFDLDLIERFLRDAQGHRRPFLWEQTAWAVMAAHAPSAYFSARQIAFPHFVFDSNRKLKWHPVAIHFVGGTRHLVADVAAEASDWPVDSEPIQLECNDSVLLTPASQLIDVCRHRLLLRKCRRNGVLQ